MFLINESMVDVGVDIAALVSGLGLGVVFLGLILLMIVIIIVGNVMRSRNDDASSEPVAVAAPAAAPAAQAAPVAAAPAPAASGTPAPGTAGELKLNGVPDRTAALIMAIVAYKTGKPLNELRFKSIKEVK